MLGASVRLLRIRYTRFTTLPAGTASDSFGWRIILRSCVSRKRGTPSGTRITAIGMCERDALLRRERRSRPHWTMLFYRVAIDGMPHPDPDEIAEARFVEIADALRLVRDEEMRSILREIC